MNIINSVDEKNILTLTIDEQDYLFKLSDHHDSDYLKNLAVIVEKKISENKKIFSIKDYQKLLILTCLNLAEDIHLLKAKVDELSPASINDPITTTLSHAHSDKGGSSERTRTNHLELIDRLETIRESLNSDDKTV